MTSETTTSLIVAGAAITGSFITGWFTYTSCTSQKKNERIKGRLKKCLQDIAAYHRLEQKYIEALATPQKSAEAWKREMRKSLRIDGYSSPSEEATALTAERSIEELR